MKLLLDSHIPKAVARALQRRASGLDVIHVADWRGGVYRDADDGKILAACFDEGRVFVSYDQQTIPLLLRRWAEQEKPHAGVIFGDVNTVPPDRVGMVVRALAALVEDLSGSDMTNVLRYLRSPRQ